MRSANGWTVLEAAPPAVQIPGTQIRVRVRPGDVATVLAYLAARFHAEVEPLDMPVREEPGYDDWGWAYRPIRDQATGFSNHASATALDLNATRHPRGKHRTFTARQKAAVRRILDDLRDPATRMPVVRWGEDYTTTVDGMHFEINASAAAVARVAEVIRSRTPVAPSADSLEEVVFIAHVPGAEDKRQFLVAPPVKMLLPSKQVADALRAAGIRDAGDVDTDALDLFATVDAASVGALVKIVPGQVAALTGR